jgi:hypothetical protein
VTIARALPETRSDDVEASRAVHAAVLVSVLADVDPEP